MSDEEYYFDLTKESQSKPDFLAYCYDKTTQAYLKKIGIAEGMRVLDIGCGTGTMTSWLSKQVGTSGNVVALDNSEIQLEACRENISKETLTNVTFELASAYDIDRLKQTFDLVYCRFVLHHLVNPREIIEKIYSILSTGGIYAAEEGLVSQAFTYPFSDYAWGSERWNNQPAQHEVEGVARDGNFGIKLYDALYKQGFRDLTINLVQPVLQTAAEKSFLNDMLVVSKKGFLQSGHNEEQWEKKCQETEQLIRNDNQIVACYQSCQVSGRKEEEA